MKPYTYMKSTVLSVGKINLPVSVYSVVRGNTNNKVKTLNLKTGNPVSYKRVDSVTGEEIGETISGYEMPKDGDGNHRFVKLPPMRVMKRQAFKNSVVDNTLNVGVIARREDVNELLLDSKYVVFPVKDTKGNVNVNFVKQYQIIVKALESKGLVLFGKGMFRDAEKDFVIMPHKGYLMVATMESPEYLVDLSEDLPNALVATEQEVLAFSLAFEKSVKAIPYEKMEDKTRKIVEQYVLNPLSDEQIKQLMSETAEQVVEVKTNDNLLEVAKDFSL